MDGEFLDTHPVVPSHVVYRSFEGETLLLNLESGEYYGLNETGSRLLELMSQNSQPLRESIRRLADEYEDHASRDRAPTCWSSAALSPTAASSSWAKPPETHRRPTLSALARCPTGGEV